MRSITSCETNTRGRDIRTPSTGTTKIGKYVLNHSFMLPGMVATVSSVLMGFVLAKMVL